MVDYKNLIVWQKSRELVKEVYVVTQLLPREEIFGLTNQIRRAAVSIASNIAEGYNRHSNREFIHFLKIAKGSAGELETQILICSDLEYVSKEKAETIIVANKEIMCMLTALISSIEKRLI